MAVATAMASDGGSGYPIDLDVSYPEKLNRWLPLIKWLLAIPHMIILYALNLAASVVTFIAFFAILFTAKYPEGLFRFVLGVQRWRLNVNVYTSLLRDEYPPFTMDAGQYPAALEVPYPANMNRWMPLVKWLLAIPHYIVLLFLGIAVAVTTVIAFFAILITSSYPRGLHGFAVGVTRWSTRVNLYVTLMTDAYPPFSLDP